MYLENRKGTHYHKGFVDADTKDVVCLCGATQDPVTKKWSHADGSGGFKKYHNKPCEYNGIMYDSTLEARVAADLDLEVRAGLIDRWERQVRISFYLCLRCAHLSVIPKCADHPIEKPTILATYVCDFKAYWKDGTIEFREAKGKSLDIFKFKWRMLEAIYGNDDTYRLTIVKEPNRVQWMFKGKNLKKNKLQ